MKTLLFPVFLFISLLSLPALAAVKPAHTADYACSGAGARAEVLDAFDSNMQRLYTSAAVRADSFEFGGFVQSESVLRGEVVFVTWTGAGFRLVGKFTPSLPNRNFSATLYVEGRADAVEMSCVF